MDARALGPLSRALCLFAAAGLVAAGCGGDDAAGTRDVGNEERPPQGVPERPPPRYQPEAAESYPNGKRVAAAVAQRALTYPRGSAPTDVARGLVRPGIELPALEAALAPAVDADSESTAEVVYPQLSGVTPTTLGSMVIVRQTLVPDEGAPESIERVVDVRLRLDGGRWQLDALGGVGGTQVARPDALSPAAERILDDPGIKLSASAGWDIYRGAVDETLLAALADAGREYDFSVGVLASGHPPNVWATPRRSAHSVGFAADIYKVDGRLVIDQQEVGSPAYEFAKALANDATQLGSPWLFGPGTFTDAVHEDHLHFQRSPTP